MARLFGLAGLVLLALAGLGETGPVERHGTVTCGASATEIRGAVTNRDGLFIYNNDASTTIYHGQHASNEGRDLTTTNGTPLPAGQAFAFERGEMTGAYHCITTGASLNLRWKETYK